MYHRQEKRFKSDTIFPMDKQFPKSLLRHCLVCERTDQEVPLIQLQYKDNVYWICPEHFPILIHKPDQLAGKLPGAEHLAPHEHGHDE